MGVLGRLFSNIKMRAFAFVLLAGAAGTADSDPYTIGQVASGLTHGGVVTGVDYSNGVVSGVGAIGNRAYAGHVGYAGVGHLGYANHVVACSCCLSSCCPSCHRCCCPCCCLPCCCSSCCLPCCCSSCCPPGWLPSPPPGPPCPPGHCPEAHLHPHHPPRDQPCSCGRCFHRSSPCCRCCSC